MQRLATFAALILMVYGAAVAGWRGALTGLVAGIGIGIGVAIVIAERGAGVLDSRPRMRLVQRIGGLIAVAGVLVGVLYGGWSSGWQWGLLGFLAGPVLAVILGALTKAGTTGDASGARTAHSNDALRAAERIVKRQSINLDADPYDLRYMVWRVGPTLSHIVADEGGYANASWATGETPETVAELLSFAGYDTKRLTAGDKQTRLFYATEASVDLFADMTAKHGGMPPDLSGPGAA